MEPHRPELHAFGFRAILEVAHEMLGAEQVEAILGSLGVRSAEFNDANAWFSAEFAEALIAAVSQRSQDPTWLARAMRLGLSPRYLGILFPLIHSFGTPGFAYRQIVKESGRFNKMSDWALQSLEPQRATLVARPVPGKAPERTSVMCECRSAQLAAIPTIFDLPAAELQHPRCVLRGDGECVYELHWREQQRRIWSWIGFLLGAAIGATIGWWQAFGTMTATALALTLACAGWALGRTRELGRDISDRMSDLTAHQDALTRSTRAHEERYKELLDAKAEVEKKVEQRTGELRATTQRLSETLNEIQALDRAKTDFFNNVSHELRSPLTLILAPLEDLAAGRSPVGGERAAFESMRRNAARLLHLINQLLDLAKIDAGQMEITPAPTDLPALLRSILKGFEAAAQKKDVRIDLRAPGAIPPVLLDASWIESAITNLVANALRFTNAGGTVRIVLEDRGADVVIVVADDGPGIAPADQDKVFARFAQGDSSRNVVGGTGIGLALVREAARLHGGDIRLRSELGKGSTFELSLPRRVEVTTAGAATGRLVRRSAQPPADDTRDDARSSERAGPSAAAPLALVVEDNPELREFMADVLAVRYRVRSAGDGSQAIALAHQLKPDVIVSDVAMPVMDGYELCRRLKADNETRTIPLLLVTARTEVASVLEGFEAGANDYVLKPFHGRELLARVDVHVRLRRMVQELALRERHAMLGVLAASVAHQVRNPLTTLVSGLPAMRSRIGRTIDARTLDLIDVMIDCSTRIERLTVDLMDLSRVDREAGGQFRPSDGLRASVRLVRARVIGGISIEDRIEESPIFEGRAGDINHVFLNILDNALRAVSETNGQIEVTGIGNADGYSISIGDSGPGVSSTEAERIFEPFFTTRVAGEGTGLGLAIARDVIKEHGGTISVGRSHLGGALFTVLLPYASSSAAEAGARESPPPQTVPTAEPMAQPQPHSSAPLRSDPT